MAENWLGTIDDCTFDPFRPCQCPSSRDWRQYMETMAKYRDALPQLTGTLFLTQGGMETTLIFNEGIALPDFAAFHLLKTAQGTSTLTDYYTTYAGLAKRRGTGLILESATWRANADWGARLGYSPSDLFAVNQKAMALLESVRAEHEASPTKIVLSGCIGPRGDAYRPSTVMSDRDAQQYHRPQVEAFASSGADMVSALTMNDAEEATGVALAARELAMPVVISFTVESDGTLPTGQTLPSAIQQVDAATSSYPSYYMINCAHPSHFMHVLATREAWLARIRGLRANASRRTHAELDGAVDLDTGDPAALGREYAMLCAVLPRLNVLGGCCGTDHRHIEQIAEACQPIVRRRE